MNKVTVVGAGNVGATVAQQILSKGLADVALVDVIEGLPQGKALDLLQACALSAQACNISGSNDYHDTQGSDIVVVTAGIARKPGMLRDDLLKTNAGIVRNVVKETIAVSPKALFIIVTNPLDVMTYLAWQASGLAPSQVIGMAGVLDSARFATFIALELGVAKEDIRAMVLGGHGDLMVPLPRFSTVNGIPITELLPQDRIDALCARTRDGGAEVVALLKSGSAFYAPGAAVCQMVEAVLKDKSRLLPCCVYAKGKYGLDNVYIGLPAILNRKGVKEVIELKLNDTELDGLKRSASSIEENTEAMKRLL